jgi:hypothetical protein
MPPTPPDLPCPPELPSPPSVPSPLAFSPRPSRGTRTPRAPRARAAGTLRRRRGRGILVVVALGATCAIAAPLFVASVTIAAGGLVVAAGLTLRQHALLPSPSAAIAPGLTLDAADWAMQGSTHVPSATDGGTDAASDTTTGATGRLTLGVPGDLDASAMLDGSRARASMLLARATDDPLAGPRVVNATPTTLVTRDVRGTLARPSPSPAHAALELLSLDPGSRRALDAALSVRAQRLDDAVIRNLPLIVLAQSSAGGGNVAGLIAATGVALARSRELIALGDLDSMLMPLVPASQRGRYLALLEDYWRAAEREAAAERAAKGEDPIPANLLRAELRLRYFGEEIERAFNRVALSGDILHYYFSRGLDLRGEQLARFRTTIADYAAEHGVDGDQAARTKLRDDLCALLRPSQQRTLRATMKGFIDG